MLIDFARRGADGRSVTGDTLVYERIETAADFAGGAAEEGVLVNFELDGRKVTGRVTRVYATPDDADRVVEVELIDEVVHDMDSGATLAHLPPANETDPTI
jgi:hypothetical protein